MRNIILFTNQFEGHIPYDIKSKKFRFYIDNPFKECEGAMATILPTPERIKTHGGVKHVTMAYGYGITLKQDSNGYYYEFQRLKTHMLSEYFAHTGKRYVDKDLNPIGSAKGWRYQYDDNFLK